VGCFAHRLKANGCLQVPKTRHGCNGTGHVLGQCVLRALALAPLLTIIIITKSITTKLDNLLISYSGGLLQLLLCCFVVWLREADVGAAALHLRAQNSSTMITSCSPASADQAGSDASGGLNYEP
jgi:hypothetical protein